MKNNYWIKACAGCPLCKYTRASKKETIFYKMARLIEKLCPWCYMANKTLKKDFQKSTFKD